MSKKLSPTERRILGDLIIEIAENLIEYRKVSRKISDLEADIAELLFDGEREFKIWEE